MSTHTEARKNQLLANTATPALYQAAVLLESARTEGLTPEQRMTRAWILDELEQRAGKLADAELPEFERIYDKTDNYLAALVALRPNLAG